MERQMNLKTRHETTLAGYPADKGSEFMRFWKTVNDVLKSRNLPQMLYGEARDWYHENRYFTTDYGHKVGPGGSVECPHCHWGYAASAIDQHLREKH
jgi:hypothetical protein